MKTITEEQMNPVLIHALHALNTEEPCLQMDLSGQKCVVLKAEDYPEWDETNYLL